MIGSQIGPTKQRFINVLTVKLATKKSIMTLQRVKHPDRMCLGVENMLSKLNEKIGLDSRPQIKRHFC